MKSEQNPTISAGKKNLAMQFIPVPTFRGESIVATTSPKSRRLEDRIKLAQPIATLKYRHFCLACQAHPQLLEEVSLQAEMQNRCAEIKLRAERKAGGGAMKI